MFLLDTQYTIMCTFFKKKKEQYLPFALTGTICSAKLYPKREQIVPKGEMTMKETLERFTIKTLITTTECIFALIFLIITAYLAKKYGVSLVTINVIMDQAILSIGLYFLTRFLIGATDLEYYIEEGLYWIYYQL